MVKGKKEEQDVNVTVLPVGDNAAVATPTPVMELSAEDKQAFELAKRNHEMARLTAEKAVAENNAAEMSYKYTVLSLYFKYGLTAADAIDLNGRILRGANTPQGQAQ